MKTSVESETRALMEDTCRIKDAYKVLQASMERETKALRDDVNSLKRENKALKWSLNRLASKVQEGWKYPVAILPDEYWQSKGYEDEAIDGLHVGFLEELKTAVSELEHGVCESVTVRFVNHDEDLVPHWNALFRSFRHINPYGAGVVLYLQSIELNEEVMRQVCYHVRHKNIRTVHFTNNEFIDMRGMRGMRGAISELGNALKSPKLKCLTWSENPIHNTEDMTLFTQVLSQSEALDKL
ncbi:hypothetical protein THAOC_10153, partial [Thalassiosira oceanica]